MTATRRMTGGLLDDGFMLLPGLLANDEIDEARWELERRRTLGGVTTCERPNNTLVPLRWTDRAVQLVLDDDARMDRLIIASSARDLRWISAYGSFKDPRSGPLWWHQDWWLWDNEISLQPSAPQVALLIYLDRTTVDLGALRVIPGSHLRRTALHAQMPDDDRDQGDFGPEHAVMQDAPGQQTVDAEPGDAVLVDYRILHGTHPNAAPQGRVCLILNFTPSWRDLPRSVRGHLIQAWGLPAEDERHLAPRSIERWMPVFDGECLDLPLSRNARTKS